jgi:hypothetical protein
MPMSRLSDEANMRDEETREPIVMASPWTVPPGYVPPPSCGPGPLEVTYLGRRLRVCTVLTTPADLAVRLDEMFPAFSGYDRGAPPDESPVATIPSPRRLHWQRDTEKTISPADDPIEGEGSCPHYATKFHWIMVAR